jgi:hypothetical protein
MQFVELSICEYSLVRSADIFCFSLPSGLNIVAVIGLVAFDALILVFLSSAITLPLSAFHLAIVVTVTLFPSARRRRLSKLKKNILDFQKRPRFSYSKKIGRKIAAKTGFCGLNSTYLQTHHQLLWSVPHSSKKVDSGIAETVALFHIRDSVTRYRL